MTETRTTRTHTATPDRETAGGTTADTGGYVTICAADGRPWGRGRFEPRARAGTEPRRTAGVLVAPLWMLSLGGAVRVRFGDGREGRLKVREIIAMDGPVATVRVDVTA